VFAFHSRSAPPFSIIAVEPGAKYQCAGVGATLSERRVVTQLSLRILLLASHCKTEQDATMRSDQRTFLGHAVKLQKFSISATRFVQLDMGAIDPSV
jgi:hypothetical protein